MLQYGIIVMAGKYPQLVLRNHTYYLRVLVPKDLEMVTIRKEIVYSLQTKDYYSSYEKR